MIQYRHLMVITVARHQGKDLLFVEISGAVINSFLCLLTIKITRQESHHQMETPIHQLELTAL